ncbi:MAG TPA: hypothetical protein PK760_01800, partial [Flavobacteriales bacterium]|nr:hypothetical protein [Flavobacteriales bacterium]
MRDKHPIDDLFREALHNASAEPPAHLAAAVLGHQRRKRRAFAWWNVRVAAIAVGVLLMGGAAYYFGLKNDAPIAHATPKPKTEASPLQNEPHQGS